MVRQCYRREENGRLSNRFRDILYSQKSNRRRTRAVRQAAVRYGHVIIRCCAAAMVNEAPRAAVYLCLSEAGYRYTGTGNQLKAPANYTGDRKDQAVACVVHIGGGEICAGQHDRGSLSDRQL